MSGLNGMNICCASAINDAGEIVGYYQYSLEPLPATLPLFASGLAGLGLLGWRRKKKANAA